MIKELVTNNRSVRTFKNTKLSEDFLKEAIDVARLSMSARNAQPLRYKIVTNDEDVQYLHNQSTYAGYLKDFNPKVEEGPKAFIIIYSDTKEGNSVYVDSGLALANMTLFAKEKGYSSIIIGAFNKENVKKYFQYDKEPIYLLGLGEANEEVEIVEVKNNDIKYYRENNVHFVPKRKLEDIIL